MDYFDDLHIIAVSRAITKRNGTPGVSFANALGLMLRGPAILRTDKGDTLIQTPFLYWSKKGGKGCWATPYGKERENLWITGEGERFDRIVGAFSRMYPGKNHVCIKESTELVEVFERLQKCWERKNDMEKYFLPVLVEEFVAAAARACEQENPYGKMSSMIRKYVQEISSDPGKEYDLKKIASEVGISPDYFRHIFRQYTGNAFHEYLLKQRFALAVRLLRETNKNIGEIAELCGFSAQCLFTMFFKKRSGVSPRQFRLKDF